MSSTMYNIMLFGLSHSSAGVVKRGLQDIRQRAEVKKWVDSRMPVMIARSCWPLLGVDRSWGLADLPSVVGLPTFKCADGLGRMALRTDGLKHGKDDFIHERVQRHVRKLVDNTFDGKAFFKDLMTVPGVDKAMVKRQLRQAPALLKYISSPGLASDKAVVMAAMGLLTQMDVTEELEKLNALVPESEKAWKEAKPVGPQVYSLCLGGERAVKAAVDFVNTSTGVKFAKHGFTAADALYVRDIFIATGKEREIAAPIDWWSTYARINLTHLIPECSLEKISKVWERMRESVLSVSARYAREELKR